MFQNLQAEPLLDRSQLSNTLCAVERNMENGVRKNIIMISCNFMTPVLSLRFSDRGFESAGRNTLKLVAEWSNVQSELKEDG